MNFDEIDKKIEPCPYRQDIYIYIGTNFQLYVVFRSISARCTFLPSETDPLGGKRSCCNPCRKQPTEVPHMRNLTRFLGDMVKISSNNPT